MSDSQDMALTIDKARLRGGRVLSPKKMFADMPWLGGVLLAVLFGGFTVATAAYVGLPIRDPEGSFGPRLIFPFSLLVLAVAVDVGVRVAHRALRGGMEWRDAYDQVKLERLRWSRYGLALVGFASFHVIYLSYRNLKSFLPFLRDVNYDAWLTDVDRWMAFGAAPAEVLHALLGTGAAAHVLDSVYLFFLPFVPMSVAVALMWAPYLRQGFFYVTALSLNWILGTASYYLLPSLGPIYVDRAMFEDLPTTGVGRLQGWLETHRLDLLSDPGGSDRIQSIAAFASLHVSIVMTAFLVLVLLGYRRLSWAALAFVVLTMLATIYFGWHYILDDIAGVAIAVLAVWIAAWLTGVDRERLAYWRSRQRPRRAATDELEPAVAAAASPAPEPEYHRSHDAG